MGKEPAKAKVVILKVVREFQLEAIEIEIKKTKLTLIKIEKKTMMLKKKKKIMEKMVMIKSWKANSKEKKIEFEDENGRDDWQQVKWKRRYGEVVSEEKGEKEEIEQDQASVNWR